MILSRGIALAFALLAGIAVAQEPPADDKAAGPAVRSQVDPGADLASLYPAAGSIGMAIAIAPDPHVPRYRRLFDLEIQAITLGMLTDGYVLDRYAFPWNGTGTEAEGAFGLMIFRCDGWRGHDCTRPAGTDARDNAPQNPVAHVRAIYIVTDTATWGVALPPLKCAARRIREQLPGYRADAERPVNADDACAPRPMKPGVVRAEPAPASALHVGLLKFPGTCPTGAAHKPLVLLGPTFSGAMDSLGEHLGDILGSQVTDACLVSSFTTVSSNQLADGRYPGLHYGRVALDDGTKLLGIANLAEAFGFFDPDVETAGRPLKGLADSDSEIAFLTEASTFGNGICSPSGELDIAAREKVRRFCASARTLFFPAAVADIRYGLDQQRERQRNDVQAAMKAALPSEHLALDVGAENGSEFPENRQSKLTAASQQLALDHVLSRLQQYSPKLVVVVATDVRDRLFLFDQLRRRLPSALLVDLETDVLLAHPDFLAASRGSLTVASASLFVPGRRLFGCERRRGVASGRNVPLASWALDGQGILADVVSRLDESSPPLTDLPCVLEPGRTNARMPVMHVVTLKGLRQVSRAFELDPKSGAWASKAYEVRAERQLDLAMAQALGFVCCLVIVLPWFWIRPMQRGTGRARFFTPSMITLVGAIASLASWGCAMRAAYIGEDPESGASLAYWSVAVLGLALAGLYACVKRVHDSGPGSGKLPRRYRAAIAVVGVVACALAAVPMIVQQAGKTFAAPPPGGPLVNRPALDLDLITRLGLDIGQGLAYHVVTAVGVVMLLMTMVSLGTGACVMTRNNGLLAFCAPCREFDEISHTPRFPKVCIVAMLVLIALIAFPSLASSVSGPRLSIFGPAASLIATLVLVITTLCASVLTSVAIHSSRRVRTIASHIRQCLSPKDACKPDEPEAECPGLWPANDWHPNLFAATPVVARVGAMDIHRLNAGTRFSEDDVRSWKTLVKEFLNKCEGKMGANDGRHRRAIFALLASEVSLYRWFVGGAVICALASVCVAYLFPLEADPLIMWNLGVLVVHALLAGYVATTFERDGVLSNILCNRPKKAEFSASLFMYAAMPFFALGFAIAVSQVPGVVDWGGGVLALLTSVGVKL